MSARTCFYCGKACAKEMRPYGPGGAWIGFDCMMADPEREKAAQEVFGAHLDAATDRSSVVMLGEETGPRPLGKRSFS